MIRYVHNYLLPRRSCRIQGGKKVIEGFAKEGATIIEHIKPNLTRSMDVVNSTGSGSFSQQSRLYACIDIFSDAESGHNYISGASCSMHR